MAKSRLPHLAAGRVEQYGGDHPHACVDIVVEGTLERGLTSVQVEFEDLADLLSDLGRTDDAAAIELANRSNLGLQAAVFTNDLSKAWWYADRIRSGTVVVNDSTDFWETFQPFGGAAGTDTGWGRQLIEEFTDLQTVSFNLRQM